MSEMYVNIVKCFAYLSIIVEISKGKGITGYDILNHVSTFGFTVSAGTVYHQLDMLEKAGLIKPNPVRRKRGYKTVYKMTEKGMATFEEFKTKWRKPLEYAARSLV